MYSRSYDSSDEREVSVPLHYDGIAFSEGTPGEEKEDEGDGCASTSAPPSPRSPILNIPFLKGLVSSGIPGGVRMPKIGKEELILVAAAAFMFFTDGGDKECAIMLLLLVFLT